MRRSLPALMAWLLLAVPIGLVGCGGGEKVGDIQDSAKVQAADKSYQETMKNYMQSKKQTKKR